jgi:large subunit ribosomal protein L18
VDKMEREEKVKRRKRRHLRVRKKVIGTPERPRLCVYKSLKHTYAQLIIDHYGAPCKVLTGASTLSPAIRDKIKNIKTKVLKAKEVGKLIAERAKKLGIKKVVFDRAGYKYHGRVKAVAEGAREGGLEF